MPRKWSKAVPDGNGPVSHDEVGLDQPTMANLYGMVKERFNKSDRKLDELTKEMRGTRQRLGGLKQNARQPRLATEADVPTNTKTCKRMEDTTADQANHGDSCSAKSVQAGPTSSTSFGMKSEPPTPPHRDDVLVDKGAAVPEPCLSPVEMRTLTAAVTYFPPEKLLQRRG